MNDVIAASRSLSAGIESLFGHDLEEIFRSARSGGWVPVAGVCSSAFDRPVVDGSYWGPISAWDANGILAAPINSERVAYACRSIDGVTVVAASYRTSNEDALNSVTLMAAAEGDGQIYAAHIRLAGGVFAD